MCLTVFAAAVPPFIGLLALKVVYVVVVVALGAWVVVAGARAAARAEAAAEERRKQAEERAEARAEARAKAQAEEQREIIERLEGELRSERDRAQSERNRADAERDRAKREHFTTMRSTLFKLQQKVHVATYDYNTREMRGEADVLQVERDALTAFNRKCMPPIMEFIERYAGYDLNANDLADAMNRINSVSDIAGVSKIMTGMLYALDHPVVTNS